MATDRNFDRQAFFELLREPTFSPTDCPNYLTYADESQYRWYARLLAPVLLATGGGPLFVGNRVATLRGTSACETWMVVRYRTHRHMLAMIANPYYAFVNRFRERGTARLELAFTEPRDPRSGLEKHRWVLGIHADAKDADAFFAAVRRAATKSALPIVYESELRHSFRFLRRPRPFDPNPLTHPLTIALGAKDEAALRAFGASAELDAALAGCAKVSVQLYRRGNPRDYLKF